MIEMAQIAERGKIDMMFLADGNGVRQMDKPALFAANSPSDRPAVFEPVTLFAAVPQHTSRIGLVATATTSYEEPFTIARKFASLDHLSGGRAGWNLVTTAVCRGREEFRPRRAHGPRGALRARPREPRCRAGALGFLGDGCLPRRTSRPASISTRTACA